MRFSGHTLDEIMKSSEANDLCSRFARAAACGLMFAFLAAARAQSVDTNPPAPVKWTTEQDHQNMMEQLGIKTIRRGKDGNNTNSPNYANYDESKANPFPNLPDALVLKNGKKVTSAEMWPQRRAEIVEDFDREIYGRVPANTPKVNWEVTSTTTETNGTIPVITKKLVGHVDNSADTNISVDIQLTLSTPANTTGPVPVMMQFGFNFGAGGFGGGGRTNAIGGTNNLPRGNFGGDSGPTWQQQVLAKGWGCAILTPTTVQ